MEASLKEKLAELDKQIDTQGRLYTRLLESEHPLKTEWVYDSRNREDEIIQQIHTLQEAKTRLITGEKLPEIIYVDREVPKYITTKHVIKSSLATGMLGAILVLCTAIAAAYAVGIFEVILHVPS